MEVVTLAGSKLLYGSEVDLFNLPSTNIANVKCDYQKITTNVPVKGNSSPIGFRIQRSSESFIDLNDSFIHVKAKIQQKDGASLLAADRVAPGNLFLHTLFQDLTVKFNDTIVARTDGLYAYQAWMRNQLKVSLSVKEGELSKAIYYKDTDPDDYSDNNSGFKQRLALAKQSKQFEAIGKISDNIFNLERYITNNVDVDIELTRSNPNFCLSADINENDKFRVDIEEVNLYVKRRILDPELYKSIQQNFSKKKKAKYPIIRTRMTSAIISQGSSVYMNTSLFAGTIPISVCLGIVSSEAYNGKLKRSPFNFKNNGITKIVMTVNGMPVVYKALECNFKNGEYLLAYNTLFSQEMSRKGNGISMSDYINGNTMFVFDIGDCANEYLQGETYGTVGLEINFADPLTEHQTLILMSEYQELIEIDKIGDVEMSF